MGRHANARVRLALVLSGVVLSCSPLNDEVESSPASATAGTGTTMMTTGGSGEPTTTGVDTGTTTPSAESTTTAAAETTSAESTSTGAPAGDCENEIVDGQETDVDCGGPVCRRCREDAMCKDDTDCASIICDDAVGTCAGPPALVWLDGADPPRMFTDAACSMPVAAGDDPVMCWRSNGQLAVDFIAELGDGRYDAGGGVELDGDLLVGADVFDGDLDEVAVFLVQTEVSGADSYDINLNHPVVEIDGRYSANLPWNATRTMAWDPGNSAAARIETMPGLIQVGETHIFELVNSAMLARRELWLDARTAVGADGANVGVAGDVALARDAHTHLYELRIYQPAPIPKQRVVIEGDLACRWNLRSQLAPEHLYYSVDDADDVGCP